MQQHISSFHEGNKPFHCEICQDMRWATRGGLVEHMASVHEGELKTYLNLQGISWQSEQSNLALLRIQILIFADI